MPREFRLLRRNQQPVIFSKQPERQSNVKNLRSCLKTSLVRRFGAEWAARQRVVVSPAFQAD
jgi:hypothetical protein